MQAVEFVVGNVLEFDAGFVVEDVGFLLEWLGAVFGSSGCIC